MLQKYRKDCCKIWKPLFLFKSYAIITTFFVSSSILRYILGQKSIIINIFLILNPMFLIIYIKPRHFLRSYFFISSIFLIWKYQFNSFLLNKTITLPNKQKKPSSRYYRIFPLLIVYTISIYTANNNNNDSNHNIITSFVFFNNKIFFFIVKNR